MPTSPGRARLALVFLTVASLLPTFLAAQQPKILAPHKPTPPRLAQHRDWDSAPGRQSAIGGLWMTGPSAKASLYLTNGLKTDPVTVTPILYLSNGVRLPIEPVTLSPLGTAIVDINQALAKQGVAPYATLYGYAEIEYQRPWAIVCASVRNVDVERSLIFVYELQPPPERMPMPARVDMKPDVPQSFEGMWWKQEPGVSAFLAVSNSAAEPANADVRVTDDQDVTISTYSLSVSPHGTKLLNFDELLSTSAKAGGIYVTSDAAPHTLVVNGGLQDKSSGYSAPLHLAANSQPQGAQQAGVSQVSFAEVGLMTGEADPMMSFPAGTVFSPYSVIRNTSSQLATIQPTIWWMEAGAPRSSKLPQTTIAPHRTANLDPVALLVSAGLGNFKGSVNLVLDTAAPNRSLLLASGSVDQKNTYVFEVSPRAVSETASKSLSYWSTGNGDDTMVTLWNPADESQDLLFTLYYFGGHYLYPIHLAPRASRMFNVSEVLHAGGQDPEGNVIPAGTHEGSAELSGADSEAQHILIAMDAGTFNVNKAICGVYCLTCNGVVPNGYYLVDSPFGVTVGNTKQQTFYMQWNTGGQYSLNSGSSWWTSNSSLATANNSGVVTGVSPGSITLYSQFLGSEPTFIANYCTPGYPCPVNNNPGGQGPGTITPKILMNGSDVTGTTQTVAAGQQIPLTASYTLPSGATLSSQSWTIPGSSSNPPTAIANFDIALNSSHGGPVSLTSGQLTQQSVTFYWIAPTTGTNTNTVSFTLNYTDSQGHSQPTTATVNFAVVAPSSPLITIVPGQVQISPDQVLLEFGDIHGTPGAKFTYSATPPLGFNGSFFWGQILTQNDGSLTCASDGTHHSCNDTTGLDTSWPYSTLNPTSDSPAVTLSPGYTQIGMTLAARMYLMWRPGTASDIPIPLGSVTWSFTGDAIKNSQTGLWSVDSSSVSVGQFQPGSAFPSWTQIYQGGTTCNCRQ